MEQSRMTKTTLIFVLVTMLLAGAESQSCTNVLISLSPCLNYITGNSSTPSSGCCSQLASVVRSQPQCLCQVLDGGSSSLGLNINQTQALALPSACNVQTPPLSNCNAASPPESPADSPAGTTESPDSPDTIPSEGGSKSVPSTPEGSSDGSSSHSTNSLIFFILLITTFVSAMAAN